ncbi:Protein of uncharacterised function TPD sequence-motif protein [uncultured archaeon]|nr:Protein of uncharacterised function TPD sequence-motif protein [uncultured archaeon]
MDQAAYSALYSRLTKPDDYAELAREYRITKETVHVLHCQKIVREVKSRHSYVMQKAPEMLERWKRGETFLKLARHFDFPPALTASIILRTDGYSRGHIQQMMKEPSSIDKPRIRRELEEALENELVYSPQRLTEQVERGKRTENYIARWLDKRNAQYTTEAQAKEAGHQGKTPDFLLAHPIDFQGKKINWIECKGSFGDPKEIRINYRKQLMHYLELFGYGVVLYWYGVVDGHQVKDVGIYEPSAFRD